MRSLLAVALAFSSVGFAAHAGAAPAPFADPREDRALTCDELRGEIVAVRARAGRHRAEAAGPELAVAAFLPGGALAPGFDRFSVHMRPLVSSRIELARQVRREGAERRLRTAETRLERLAGLYLTRGCRSGNPVQPRPPGPGEIGLGAAD